jgi:polar amino acid transport system substrate-binding protein
MGGIAYSRMHQEVPHLLDEMQDAAKRIKRIVDDLKHFSRKSDADSKELVNVNDVVKTSLRLAEHSLRRSAIHCAVHYAEPIPLISGNAQRLEQVIVNLILNAAQAIEASLREESAMVVEPPAYGSSYSPGLHQTGKGISIATVYDHEAGVVLIKVHDDGVGIPPEHLSRLTDPFFTTKRDTGGTGLGLAISAEIVREHGGTIGFTSVPDMGATVVVTLPTAVMEVRT